MDQHESRVEQGPASTPPGVEEKVNEYRYFSTGTINNIVVARVVDCFLQGEVLAEMMRLELIQIVRSSQCAKVIVDFQNVKMITSSVILGLLLLQRQLADRQISLWLCSVSSIRDVIRMMSVNQGVGIFDCLDSALDSLDATGQHSEVNHTALSGRNALALNRRKSVT